MKFKNKYLKSLELQRDRKPAKNVKKKKKNTKPSNQPTKKLTISTTYYPEGAQMQSKNWGQQFTFLKKFLIP